MRKFKTLLFSSLAVGGLVFAGCEKRSPNTDLQGKGYTESTTPNEPAAADERQPVSGSETNKIPSPNETTTGPTATPSTVGPGGELELVTEDGTRTTLSDTVLITQVQQKLATSGAYRGEIDGMNSPELTAAIQEFQKKQGLPETGDIDRKTADALGLDWSRFTARAGDDSKSVGDMLRGAASDVEREANEAAGEIQRTAGEAETGAEGVRQDVESGAKELGSDVERGANEAAEEIQEGARGVEREVDERTR